jgi:hypothetical protein
MALVQPNAKNFGMLIYKGLTTDFQWHQVHLKFYANPPSDYK